MFALLLILLGCPAPDEPGHLTTDDDPGEDWPDEAALRDAACADDVVVADAGSPFQCVGAVLPDGWTAEPFFALHGWTATEVAELLPPSLGRWCVYTREDPAAEPLPFPATPDCAVVVPLGSAEVAAEALPQAHDAFMVLAEQSPPPPPVGPTPWVAVVDTMASVAVDPPDRAGHGCALSALIQELACGGADADDPACSAVVGHHLALPRTVDPSGALVIDPDGGGHFGTLRELGLGIVEGLLAWQYQGQGAPLILNLSVGWDGRYNDDGTGAPRAAVRAVRDVLDYAACQGVLVVAAAGNQVGGPDPGTGPMYPAAWEDETTATCAGGTLLYAVGGVDPADRPLLAGRPGGLPRLVAPAWHAAADIARYAPTCGEDGVQTHTLTGTSVAAALATATAASVWALRPDLGRRDVMALVHGSGEPLALPADFGVGAGDPVQRLSRCAALQVTCATIDSLGGSAPGCPVACTPRDAAAPLPPLDVAVAEDLRFVADAGLEPPSCGASACPWETWGTPLALPNVAGSLPGVDPCTECWLQRVGDDIELVLPVNTRFDGTLRAARLALAEPGGERVLTWDLARATSLPPGRRLGTGVLPGQVVRLRAPGTDLTGPARLEFRVDYGDRTVSTASWLELR